MIKKRPVSFHGIITSIFILFSLTGILYVEADGKKIGYWLKPTSSAKETVTDHKTTVLDFTNKRVRTENDSIYSRLRFSGYDKQISAARESFFITNNTGSDLKSLSLEINYTTPDGRQLHRRQQRIDQYIPTGETRKIEIPTWDKQKSFYYIKSSPPRKGGAAYDISFSLLSVTLVQINSSDYE